MKRKAFAIVMSLLLLLSLVPVMSGAALAAFEDPDGNHVVGFTTTIPVVLGIDVSPALINFGTVRDDERSSEANALDSSLGQTEALRTISVVSTGNCDQLITTAITGEERTVEKEKLGYGNGVLTVFGPTDYTPIDVSSWTVYEDDSAVDPGDVNVNLSTGMVTFTGSAPAGGVLVNITYSSKSKLYSEHMYFDDAATTAGEVLAADYGRELVDDETATIVSDIYIPVDYPYGVDNIEMAQCTIYAAPNVGTNYILTMNKNVDGGDVDPPVGAHSYPLTDPVTDVTITATPDPGWEFVNWTGDVADPNSASTTVTMDADKTVTANFAAITYNLTMAAAGDGTTDPAVGVHTYAWGEVVPITAIDGATAEFTSWTGDVANPASASTTVTMDADKTVTANFGTVEYTLTMAVSGSGSTDPAVGGHLYVVGTVVSITATPGAGQEFVNWTGDVADSGSASTTVTVDADKTVTANFAPITYDLTMAVIGSGSTTPAVGVHNYAEGTVVTVTAVEDDPYWEFDSWTGNVADTGSISTTVTMNADETVTANFTMKPTPVGWTYTVDYTFIDPDAPPPGDISNTSNWLVTLAGPPAPYSTPYYSGDAVQMNVDYDALSTGIYPVRVKLGFVCDLLTSVLYFDAATNRMMYQTAVVDLGGTLVDVQVTNEWLDNVGRPDRFIAHTVLIGGGPPDVLDEYHEVVPGAPAPVTVPAGTYTCATLTDYMIGEGRQYNGTALGTGDGSTTDFVSAAGGALGVNDGEEVVWLDPDGAGILAKVRQYRGTDYTIDYGSATVSFTTAPASGAVLTMDFNFSLYTTGGDPTTGRLWRVDYVDSEPDPGLNVGLVQALDYLYGWPDGESTQVLTSVIYP